MSEGTKAKGSIRHVASKSDKELLDQNKETTQIAYQNKDIKSKFLAENFKGKTFRVYGLNLPEIKQVFPTNIPTVKVNELRLDNLFEPADGSRASTQYDIGAVKMNIETAFLSELNAGEIFRQLKEKVEKNQLLSDEEKIIDMETANRIRRAIEMTQVAQIFEEEKRQEVEQVKRQAEKEKRQALRGLQQQIVIEMIKKNYSVEEITSLVSGYTQSDVEELRKKIML